MMRPWDEEPDKYRKEISCEDCGSKLEEHFERCEKCGSSSYHQVEYVRKSNE